VIGGLDVFKMVEVGRWEGICGLWPTKQKKNNVCST